MAIQIADGWILDVIQDHGTSDINLLISNIISFRQRLKEYTIYIQPKSYSAGEDLFQQLSRNDEVIKKIFWDRKYIDLQDKTKTRLIGISITDIQSESYQTLIKKLRTDLRVRSIYNIELSATQQFIYNRLKIAPTSRVRIEFEKERLLSITKVDNGEDVTLPPFSMMHIRISSGSEPKLNVQTSTIRRRLYSMDHLTRALALMLMRTNQTLLLSMQNTDKIKAYSIQNVMSSLSNRAELLLYVRVIQLKIPHLLKWWRKLDLVIYR